MIAGPVWSHDRYHQGTSTGPGWSQCEYLHNTQHRYDHMIQRSLYWRINYYICAQKIPHNLLCPLCSVGCRTAVWKLRQLYSTLSGAFRLWSMNSISQVVAGFCLWWSSRAPELGVLFHWSVACIDWLRITTVGSEPLESPQPFVKHPYTVCDSQLPCSALGERRGQFLSTDQHIPNIMWDEFWHQFFIRSPKVNKKNRHFTQNTARSCGGNHFANWLP